jgi:hypothetical protein
MARPGSTAERLRAHVDGAKAGESGDATGAGALDEAISTILATFHATEGDVSWKVSVCRVGAVANKLGGKEEWLFDTGVEDLPGLRTVLRDQYKGGQFRARVYKNEGGSSGLVANFTLDIAPPLTVPGAGPPAADSAPNEQTTLAQMFATMMDRQEKMLERVLARVSAPATAASPLASIKETLEVITSVVALQPKSDSKAGLEMFKEGLGLARELAKNAGGGDGGEGGLLGLAGKLLDSPILERVLSALPVASSPMLHQTPAPNGRPAPLPAPSSAAPVDPVSQLRPLVAYLVEKASRGADPALYADWLVDNLTPQAEQFLSQQPDLMGALATGFPEILAHRAWFEVLIQTLTTPPEGQDNESSELPGEPAGRAAGGQGNAQAHAGQGEARQAEPAG